VDGDEGTVVGGVTAGTVVDGTPSGVGVGGVGVDGTRLELRPGEAPWWTAWSGVPEPRAVWSWSGLCRPVALVTVVVVAVVVVAVVVVVVAVRAVAVRAVAVRAVAVGAVVDGGTVRSSSSWAQWCSARRPRRGGCCRQVVGGEVVRGVVVVGPVCPRRAAE